MKRLIAILALLCAPAAFAYNSSGVVALPNYTTTTSYTTTWSVSAGDTLLVLENTIDNNNNTSALQSVFDGQGTYTQDAVYDWQTHSWFGVWRLSNANAGTHAIDLQPISGGDDYSTIVVLELPGTWSFDTTWLYSGNSYGTSISFNASAPTGSGNLQIGMASINLTSDPPSQTPVGWTSLGLTGSQWPSGGWAYISSNSAQTLNWGTTMTAASWGGLVVDYQQSAVACSHNFWSSTGGWTQPNGSSGSFWNVASGTFSTPNCSTGSFWRQDGNKAAN